jgi:hypothetical protein
MLIQMKKLTKQITPPLPQLSNYDLTATEGKVFEKLRGTGGTAAKRV